MQAEFFATQAVTIPVPARPVPVQHYLRQPRRLVSALTDPSRVDSLDSDCFRLKMRPLSFMMLSLQPTVDLRVTVAADGLVQLRSVGCEIRGIEYINQRFQLDLVGRLWPDISQSQTQLRGQADLRVVVDLPPPLWLTPRPILEASGNGLLKSVLLTFKQRLMYQLVQDYCVWADEPTNQPPKMGLESLPV